MSLNKNLLQKFENLYSLSSIPQCIALCNTAVRNNNLISATNINKKAKFCIVAQSGRVEVISLGKHWLTKLGLLIEIKFNIMVI